MGERHVLNMFVLRAVDNIVFNLYDETIDG